MTKSKRTAAPSHLLQRMVASQSQTRYEGHVLSPLVRGVGAGNREAVSVGFDMSGAPVPQRRYAAEVCSVRERLGDLQMIFGQETLAGEVLDSALIIRMNPDAASRFLDAIMRMDNPSLAVIAETVGVKALPLVDVAIQPSQMVNVVANIGTLAVSGYESCIDFYHASPFAMKAAKSGGGLAVEPVVRVDLRTSHLLSLVDALKSLSTSWPKFSEEE